jgi:hypothetical protein
MGEQTQTIVIKPGEGDNKGNTLTIKVDPNPAKPRQSGFEMSGTDKGTKPLSKDPIKRSDVKIFYTEDAANGKYIWASAADGISITVTCPEDAIPPLKTPRTIFVGPPYPGNWVIKDKDQQDEIRTKLAKGFGVPQILDEMKK